MKKSICLIFVFCSLNVIGQGLQFQEESFSNAPFEGLNFSSSAFADVDGDNDLDVLITGQNASNTGVTKLYLNNGSGNYTLSTINNFVGLWQGSVGFADIDNDSDKDLLITGINSSAQYVSLLYKNNGSGIFTLQTGTPFVGVFKSDIAFADLNNDGDLDLVLTGQGGVNYFNTVIYDNNGSGIFTENTTNSLEGLIASTVSIGDIDGDGDNDIFISGLNTSVERVSRIYLNGGSNTYTIDTINIFDGYFRGDSKFADFDNDNDLDLIITGRNVNGFEETVLYQNNGSGVFTEITNHNIIGAYYAALSTIDLNNDGLIDVLISGSDDNGGNYSRIYINRGNFLFEQLKIENFIDNSTGSISVGDVDADSDIDVLITGWNGNTYFAKLYKNNPIFCLPNVTTIDTFACNNFITPDNISHNSSGSYTYNYMGYNGCDSTITINYTIDNINSILLNFSENPSSIFPNLSYSKSTYADIDGDGDVDLLVCGSNSNDIGTTVLFNNNGSGLFTEILNTNLLQVYQGDANFVDIDNDGDKDLVIGGYLGQTGNLRGTKIYTNNGLGIFTEIINQPFNNIESRKISFGDLDNDGDLDLLIAGYDNSSVPITNIYKNNGFGNFTLDVNNFITSIVGDITIGDIDLDLDLDIIISGYAGYNAPIQRLSKIYKNNGLGIFSEFASNIENVWSGNLSLGDMDNDGDLDLFLTGQNNSDIVISKLYDNDGIGNFSLNTTSSFESLYVGLAIFTDIDNDGDLDIFNAGQDATNALKSQVYLNSGSGSYSLFQNSILDGFVVGDASIFDTDNDRDIDIFISGFNSNSIAFSKLYENTIPCTPYLSEADTTVCGVFVTPDGEYKNVSGQYYKLWSNPSYCKCDSVVIINYTIIPNPIAPALSIYDTTISKGESVTLSASNCSSGVLQWSNNFNGSSQVLAPLDTIFISASCNNNGCASIENITSINIIEKPYVYSLDSNICATNSLNIKAKSLIEGANIQWFRNDTLVSGAIDSSLIIANPGNYSFKHTIPSTLGVWTSQNSPISYDLKDVTFLNERNGWAIGGNGIINTRNGGKTWQIQYTGKDFSQIQILNDSTGYVLSTLGEVLKTRDGGITWVRTETNTNNNLKRIHFVNNEIGWAVGDSATVINTIDGGSNWNIIATPLQSTFAHAFGVYFKNVNNGYIGAYDHILKTTDGGLTWQQQFGTTNYAKDFISTSDTITYVIGNDLIKTSDDGINWTNLNIWDTDYQFLNDTLGWIGGFQGNIKKTVNGGQSWLNMNISTGYKIFPWLLNDISSFDFIEEDLGWAVGTSGIIFKWSKNKSLTFESDTISITSYLESPTIISTDTTICGVNTIELSATGCENGDIKWSDSQIGTTINVTPLTSQNYKTLCLKNGCTSDSSQAIAITVIPLPDAPTFSIGDTSICQGTTLSITASACSNSNLKWSNNFNGNQQTITPSHSISLFAWCESNNGCQSTQTSLQITVLAKPYIYADTTNLCADSVVVLHARGINDSTLLQWYKDGVVIEGATDSLLTITSAGNYSVALMKANNQSEWVWLNPKLPVNEIFDSYFINQIGLNIGNGGLIQKTIDGGATWKKLPTPTSGTFKAVYFVNENIGWVVGYPSIILKTVDGGNSWVQQNSSLNYIEFRGVSFTSTNEGFIVGSSGTILKTTDGGQNWQSIVSGTYQSFNEIQMLDNQTGWIAGDKDNLLKTIDGGATWTNTANINGGNTWNNFKDLTFKDALHGWAVGESRIQNSSGPMFPPMEYSGPDVIYRTADGGITWIASSLNNTYNANLAISFANNTVGWLSNESGSILKTTNGGQSWVLQNSTGNKLNSVTAVNDSLIYAFGVNGNSLKSSNGGNSWLNSQSTVTSSSFKKVDFTSKQKGWALAGTQIFHTDNGGKTWFLQFTGDFWNEIQMLNDTLGYVASSYGQIAKTTNGGQNWTYTPTNTSAYLFDIHFSDSQNGWAVGDNGTVIHTTNGGQSWTAPNTPITGTYSSSGGVYFINANIGYISGSGFVMKTVDGGLNWVTTNGVTAYAGKMQITSGNIGYLMGNEMMKTTNGGQSWSTLGDYAIDFYFLNDTLGWKAGIQGSVLKTTNGGLTWISMNAPTSNHINSIVFRSESEGWAVGNGGQILKFQPKLEVACLSDSINISKILAAPQISSLPQTVCGGQTVNLNASGCINGIIKWNNGQTGTSITVQPISTTTYRATCHQNNCISDSSNIVTVIVKPKTYGTISLTECVKFDSPSGKFTYLTSGVYSDTLINSVGCDSIISINLTIINKSYSNIQLSSCVPLISPSGNSLFSNTGIYSDTLINSNGCDSILTINFSLLNNSFGNISVAQCDPYTSPSGKLMWESSGVYKDTLLNAAGCDSIITINFELLQKTYASVTKSQCGSLISPSGNFVWTSSGVYLDTLVNYAGCDSIITVNLTILESTTSSFNITSCGPFLAPDDSLYQQSGIYNIIIPNSVGCDSLITLNLEVEDPLNKNLSFNTFSAGLPNFSWGKSILGDIDGDGDNDLFIIAEKGNPDAKLFINNGNGQFTEVQSGIFIGMFDCNVFFSDIDLDGDLDIITSGNLDYYSSATHIYKNNGFGVFSLKSSDNIPGIGKGLFSVGDLNGDSFPDIIVSNYYYSTSTNQTSIYLNDTQGNFINKLNHGINTKGDLNVIDLNNDGYLDVIFPNDSKVYLNSGSANFVEKIQNTNWAYPSPQFDFIDYENDGDIDVLISNYSKAGILLNDGSGIFSEQLLPVLPNISRGETKVIDLDGDNYLDLIITGNSVSKIFMNVGGLFIDSFQLEGMSSSSISAGDIDGDKDIDLILVGYGSNYNASTHVYKNSIRCLPEEKITNIVSCGSYITPDLIKHTISGQFIEVFENANGCGCDSTRIINYTILPISSQTIQITSCNPYTSPSGNFIWSNSGIYTDTLTNIAGCDSIITINLTVSQPAIAVLSGNKIIASGQSASLNILFSGTSPFSAIVNGIAYNNITQQNFSFNVSPSQNTNYTISSISNSCGVGTSTGQGTVSVDSSNPCISIREIPIGISSGGIYKAVETIKSSAIVGNPTNYKAGNSIELNPGFKVDNGVVFNAEIGSCN